MLISSLFIALGGALGALSRFAFLTFFSNMLSASVALLLCNTLGSFVAGMTLYKLQDNLYLNLFIVIGFLGAFTTFSSFSMQMLQFLQSNNFMSFFFYSFAHFILTISSCWLGYRILL